VDVVVVGFGAAGLSAAITAHDAGASVLVLEKMPEGRAGGNSRVSGQVWFSPTDTEKAMVYLRALAGAYPIEERLARAWAEETAGNDDWVIARAREAGHRTPIEDGDPFSGDRAGLVRLTRGQHGADTDRDAPYLEFGDIEGADCGADYVTIGGSRGFGRLWLLLKTCVEERQIPVLFDTAAQRLVVDPAGGEVVGIVARRPSGGDLEVDARAGVILACGGFAANAEMTRNYLRLPRATPWGSPGNTGDGIRMAQRIGADLAHPYNYMSVPGIAVPPYCAGHRAEPKGNGFIHVGRDGRRFCNEIVDLRHGKARRGGSFDFFPGGPMWTIFDERTRLGGPLVPPRAVHPFGWNTQVERHVWSHDNRAEVDRGWIARGDAPEDLARRLGIDGDALAAEIAEFNDWATRGQGDQRFGRPQETMQPLEPPFFGYEWAELLITTLGGVRKDERARAVDPWGRPIPGLYCAGDVASTYTWSLSGGMGLGDALAFGRIAGREVTARAVDTRRHAASGRGTG
jgi:succinate dehydrogenase/fumarate reductase flavoprotein subunit